MQGGIHASPHGYKLCHELMGEINSRAYVLIVRCGLFVLILGGERSKSLLSFQFTAFKV